MIAEHHRKATLDTAWTGRLGDGDPGGASSKMRKSIALSHGPKRSS